MVMERALLTDAETSSSTSTSMQDNHNHNSNNNMNSNMNNFNTASSLQTLVQAEEMALQTHEWRLLKELPATSFQNPIWREKVAQWFYDLVDHLDEPREIVYVAMNILDKYLATTATATATATAQCTDQHNYKQTAIAALFATLRLVGRTSVELRRLLQLTGARDVSPHSILTAGKAILHGLSWEHRILTPLHFVQSLLVVIKQDVQNRFIAIFEAAMYLSELQIFDSFFLAWPPSCMGAVALLQAIEHVVAESEGIQQKVYQAFNEQQGSSSQRILEEGVRRLATLYCQSEGATKSSTSKKTISNEPTLIPISEDDEAV